VTAVGWLLIGLTAWAAVAVPAAFFLARFIHRGQG
jgi:hypothetical protein